jgi:hypothetical protein
MARWRTAAIGAAVALAGMLAPRAAHGEEPAIRFRDATERAGLRAPLAGMMGHGGAWGDFDGDGRIDLYVGNFSDRPDEEYAPADGPVRNQLFRNAGDGRFEPAGQTSVEFHARTSGAVFADLDNDGALELYVANNAKPKTSRSTEPQRSAQLRHGSLFRNDDGRLIDVSAESGACPKQLHTARNVGVLDYDADGRLDLLVIEDRFTRNPRSVLLHNEGGLRFRDATSEAGLPDDLYGLGLAIADLNGDRRPDFFVGHSNRLFLSRGDGTYFESPALRELFAWKPLDAEDWPCGVAFGDLNRDGRLDLVLSIHSVRARNRVYLNTGVKDGAPTFRDITKEAGLGATVPIRCPHVEIQDFDNDGWPDIYTTAAWLDTNGKVTPLIYRHQGLRDGLPRFAPPRPIDSEMVYYPTGPSGDYDGDGRLDLFLINWFQGNHSRLLHNESPKQNWLQVRAVGREVNRMGLGAQVRVYRAGENMKPAALLGFQEIATGYGYAAGQPAVCHFGLGDEAAVDVKITFPNGKTVARRDVPADQTLVVEEPE